VSVCSVVVSTASPGGVPPPPFLPRQSYAKAEFAEKNKRKAEAGPPGEVTGPSAPRCPPLRRKALRN
jgi:hypothetical protein